MSSQDVGGLACMQRISLAIREYGVDAISYVAVRRGPAVAMGVAGSRGRAVSSRDDDSFDQFVAEHQRSLVRFAALLAGSQAQGEDYVQEVLIRVYKRWPEVSSGPTPPLAYVRRAITNEHISWHRRWSTRHIFAAGGNLPDVPITDPIAHGPEQDLWDRVRALPNQQRAAVLLRYLEGLSDLEIAEILQCREVTVRTNISRGLRRLRLEPAPAADAAEGNGP